VGLVGALKSLAARTGIAPRTIESMRITTAALIVNFSVFRLFISLLLANKDSEMGVTRR